MNLKHESGPDLFSSLEETPQKVAMGSGLYRFCRALVRIWFALSFHKIRLLHGEELSGSAPAIFAVSHPESFLDALILVAAFDRQVHCLVERKRLRGPLARLLARGLSIIPWEPGDTNWAPVVEACTSALAKGNAVVIFAQPHGSQPGEPAELAVNAASLALEAEARHSGQLGLVLSPVHMFLPVVRSQSSELLIYIDAPLFPRDYEVTEGGDFSRQVNKLAGVVERRYRQNAFRLQPEDLKQFASHLEEVLRVELAEDWALRPNWKQNLEEFQLSGFAVEWAEQLNYLNPGRLVALRESVDAWRQARRRCALQQLEVETTGKWINSPMRRVAVWLETLVGLGVALYGLANHLLILLLLYFTGSLKKESGRDPTVNWLIRGMVVLGCYAGQSLLVALLSSRATAGYYAPTLPLSGLYVWRYLWLLPHRTRPAFQALSLPMQASKVRRMRREFIEDFNEALAVHVEALGLPH